MKKKVFGIILFVFLIMSVFLISPTMQIEAKSTSVNVLGLSVEGETLGGGSDEGLDEGLLGGEGGTEPGSVNAEIERQIEEDLKDGYELNNTNDITDTRLYSALLRIANEYIRTTYSYDSYSSTTIWNSMFKEIEEVTIVNKDIESLSGMEKIWFTKLKKLTIIGNEFTIIPNNFFARMENLEELNLACNKLTTIEFPASSKIRKVNLSSNNLTNANLSSLTYPNLEINVANNNISSITNVGFSTKLTSLKLNIINNNILDISEDYFTNPIITTNVGVQGLITQNETTTVTTLQGLNYYKLNMPNVYMKIFKMGKVSDTFVKTISDSDIVDGYSMPINLGVGEYYIEYYDENGELYVNRDSEKALFKTVFFNVIPSEPTAKYEFKGKIYDTFDNKVTGKVKVLLECEEGGEIYFKVSGSDWIQGNEIMCDRGGNYSISVKCIKDGVESKEKSILIKTSLNVLIPDIVMLILILLFTLVLFLFVVPLVSKKWFRK